LAVSQNVGFGSGQIVWQSSKKMNIQKIIFGIICLEVFLIPLFFLPFTSNMLDLNKEVLFIALTAVAVVLWFAQGLKNKNLKLNYVPLCLLAPAFLLIYTLASMMSQNRSLSFLGAFQSGSGLSWFGMVFMVMFYFLVINYIKTGRQIRTLITALSLSGFVGLTLFGLNIFGKSLWPWLAVQTKSFNTIGSVSNFALFIGLTMILAIGTFLIKESKNDSNKKLSILRAKVVPVFLLVFILASLVCLQAINFKMVWPVLIISSFVFIVLTLAFYNYLNIGLTWMWLIVLVFMLSSISYFMNLPTVIDLGLPTEVSLSPGLSRTIATQDTLTGAKNFVLGSGPITFNYAFSYWRPASFNQNILWQWRFNQPTGYFWEVLDASGWLGLASLASFILLLSVSGFFILLRLPKLNPVRNKLLNGVDSALASQMTMLVALLSCFIGLGAAFWLAVPSFSLIFLFWLVAGFVSTALMSTATPVRNSIANEADSRRDSISNGTSQKNREVSFSFQASPKYALIVSFISVLVFSFVAFLTIGGIRYYLGAVYSHRGSVAFSQATANKMGTQERQDKLAIAEKAMKQSLSLHKDEPQNLMILSQISFNQAIEGALKPQDQRDLKAISNFLALAVNQSKRATDLSPFDAALWEARANLLKNAQSFTSQVRDFAIKAFEQNINLEPTNPAPLAQLGQLYYDSGRATDKQQADLDLLSKAQEYLEKSLTLKPDLTEARLSLINVFEGLGNIDQAIKVVQQGLQVSSNDSSRLNYELGRLYYNQFVMATKDFGDAAPSDGDQENLKLAIANFEKAVGLNPIFANGLYSLSLAYEQQAGFDSEQRNTLLQKSIALMEQVAKLNPDRQDVLQKIEQLNSTLVN